MGVIVRDPGSFGNNWYVPVYYYRFLRTQAKLFFPYREDHETDTKVYRQVRRFLRGSIDLLLSGVLINFVLFVWFGLALTFLHIVACGITLFVISKLLADFWKKVVEGCKDIGRSF